MEDNSNGLSFFKFFLPRSSSKHLEIPSAFTLSMQGDWPENVVLHDRYNNSWQVKVGQHRDKFYLRDGWEKFVDDNSIEGGDVIFFEYFGNGVFVTKIHDSTACEKKRLGARKSSFKQQKKVPNDNYALEWEKTSDEVAEEIPTNDYAPHRKDDNSSHEREKATRTRRVSDLYRAEIFQSGFVQPNLHFARKISSKRKRQLRLPSAFTLSVQGALPERVFFQDRYENTWQVKVEKVRSRLYFGDGWTDFVEDNGIRVGHIVFFEYSGNGLFKTKIHDSTACKKKRFGACKAEKHRKKAVNEEREAPKYIEENREIKMENEGNDVDDNYEFNYDNMADDVEEEIPTNDRAPEMEQETTTGEKKKRTRTRRVTDIYGREIFKAGLMPVPVNPYFVTKINTKRKGELYIPKEVVRDNILDLPDEIVMIDPHGRTWTAKGKIWKDGRRYYTRGWRRLCQRNFVEDEDICICEFIETGQSLIMDVSFVREETYNYY
ncbi:hypothetical protein ACP275_10G121000 [Erythranthe tilingii]